MEKNQLRKSGSKLRRDLSKILEVSYRGKTEARNNLVTHLRTSSEITEATGKTDYG